MKLTESDTFRLLRLAARFRSTPGASNRSANVAEVASMVNTLMQAGIYAEEFAYLEDPQLNHFQMLPLMESFLQRLDWAPCDDEKEFLFLTALYAEMGAEDDISAYDAISRWMDDVGHELNESFSVKYVADRIGAERIYGSYYSYSALAGGDLIPSVPAPEEHDWEAEGDARPKIAFANWLTSHPDALERYKPIDTELLRSLSC